MVDAAHPLRVRFAPAPSGSMHVGNVRTGLFNWLHARANGGTLILRIEDTDRTRATDEAMHAVLDALHWLGFDWDEGPEVRGPYGPYRQSERAELHAAVVRRLLDTGAAYEDYATTDELEAYRETRRKKDAPPVLKGPLRSEPRPGETDPPSVRLRTPESGQTVVDDIVRGEVTFAWKDIGDFVVQRADSSATYPLANTVDDVAQGVRLVCRGEDLLSVTPRQVFLYGLLTEDRLIDEALEEVGLPARDGSWDVPSEFAHLPLIVGEDRKPLSKRHGDVSIQEFERKGYLPDVLVNYLALLGWGPGDGSERLTVDELQAAFDLHEVGKTAAAFDEDKLAAFNGERIRGMSAEALASELLPFLNGTHGEAIIGDPPSDAERETLVGLVPLVQERMQRLDEVADYAPPFFVDDLELDPESVKKVLGKATAPQALEAAADGLGALDEWTTDAIEEVLRGLVEELDSSAGKVFQPVRVAATGSRVSPPLFESLELIGRDESLARIRAAIPVARDAASG